MPKYQVRLYERYVRTVEVEANDPKEALHKAYEKSRHARPVFFDEDGEVVYELDEYGSPDGPPVLET